MIYLYYPLLLPKVLAKRSNIVCQTFEICLSIFEHLATLQKIGLQTELID